MSTIYTSTIDPHADCRAPRGYKGRRRMPRRNFLYVGLATLMAGATVACGVGAPSDQGVPDAGTRPTADATTAPKAKAPAGIGDGQHKVGADIKPGTYTTTVPVDALNCCYWARLRNFDGDVLTSIHANGNLAPGAKGRIVVKKTDAGVEFTGGCRWVKAAK